MDSLLAPHLYPFTEEPRIGGLAVRRPPAPAHKFPTDVIVHQDFVPVVSRGLDTRRISAAKGSGTLSSASTSSTQSHRQASMPALRRWPSFAQSPSTRRSVKTGRNFLRLIGALVQKHDDLVGEGQPLQAVGDLMALVADADNGGQGSHARASWALLHKSRAASTAWSTPRLPMSEPEVKWSKTAGKCLRRERGSGPRRTRVPKAHSGTRGWARRVPASARPKPPPGA